MKQGLMGVTEFVRLAEEEQKEKVASLRWGDWVYDKELMTLTNMKYDYEIDLEEVSDSAAILDWIFQVFNKGWEPLTVYHLLEAFQDLLNPQGHYCSGAISGCAGQSCEAKRLLRS